MHLFQQPLSALDTAHKHGHTLPSDPKDLGRWGAGRTLGLAFFCSLNASLALLEEFQLVTWRCGYLMTEISMETYQDITRPKKREQTACTKLCYVVLRYGHISKIKKKTCVMMYEAHLRQKSLSNQAVDQCGESPCPT